MLTMQRWYRPARAAALVALAWSVLAAGLVAPTQVARAAWSAPSAPAAASTTHTAVALAWKPVWGAPRYQVAYSANSDFSSAQYLTVSQPYAEVTGLRSAVRHYFKVRVGTTTGGALSGYSSAFSTATRGSTTAYRTLSPARLRAEVSSPTSLGLIWTARDGAGSYEVKVSPAPDLSGATSRTFPGTSGTIGGLAAGTRYYLAVRALDSAGAVISTFSTAASALTATSGVTAPLRAISYNVMCANCSSTYPWAGRRGATIAAIKSQDPDVIGLQEASPGWIYSASGAKLTSQFGDLVTRLGTPYRLTNPNRYNCANSGSPSKCVPVDQGASFDAKIVYNSDRIELLDEGSRRLPYLKASDTERYVSWAIFRQLSTGKRFFFADVHIEPTNDVSGSTAYHELRRKQAQQVIATIAAKNPDRLPVLIVGDLKENKYASPDNAPYGVIVGAGYLDPLGNSYKSTVPAAGASVEYRLRTEYNTKNNFAAKPPKSTYINGSYIDYIFTSAGVRTAEWETVVDIDASGAFRAVPPSDHNMVRATVYLP